MKDRNPCSLGERRPKSILKRSTVPAPQPPKGILKLATKPAVYQKSYADTPDPTNHPAGYLVSDPLAIPVADIAQDGKTATANDIETNRDTLTPPEMAVTTVGKKAIQKMKVSYCRSFSSSMEKS